MTTAGMGNPTPNLNIKRYLSTTPVDADPEDYLSRAVEAVDEALPPFFNALDGRLDILEGRRRYTGGLIGSASTNAQGEHTFAHGLGATPAFVIITGGVAGAIPDRRTYAVVSANATTCTIRVYRQDTGGVFASNPISFYFMAST